MSIASTIQPLVEYFEDGFKQRPYFTYVSSPNSGAVEDVLLRVNDRLQHGLKQPKSVATTSVMAADKEQIIETFRETNSCLSAVLTPLWTINDPRFIEFFSSGTILGLFPSTCRVNGTEAMWVIRGILGKDNAFNFFHHFEPGDDIYPPATPHETDAEPEADAEPAI